MEDFELSRETKTVKQIVKEYLKRHGYDGLVLLDQDCGCDLGAREDLNRYEELRTTEKIQERFK